MESNVLSYAIHKLSHYRIIDEFSLAIDVGCKLTAHGDFLIQRIEVDLVFVDVSLANKQRVLAVIELAFRSANAAVGGRRGGILSVARGFVILRAQRHG